MAVQMINSSNHINNKITNTYKATAKLGPTYNCFFQKKKQPFIKMEGFLELKINKIDKENQV